MTSEAHGPLQVSSIAQVHAFAGLPPPAHPHVSVIAAAWQPPLRIVVPVMNRKIQSELYAVSLKRGDECRLLFGRQVHDAQAGTVVFLAPGQTMIALPVGDAADDAVDADVAVDSPRWTLLFHPDALVGTPLTASIRSLGFFQYAPEEALHLTDAEQATLTALVQTIEREASAPDSYSTDVLGAHIQLVLGYCQRFYHRQFQRRALVHGKTLTRLQRYLDEYLSSSRPRDEGLPTVAACARALGYSADYLSDLLREETGESARDHIHRVLIDAAKRRLTGTSESVSEIAYALGFEHAQHFSKLFKQKTGLAPGAWRGGTRAT